MEPCDRQKVERFDYSSLSPSLRVLSKPAQRALVNNGIHTPSDLAQWGREAVAALHGVGPSAFPKLEKALREEGLDFRDAADG